MNQKIESKKFLQLAGIVLGIYILSAVLAFANLARMHAYIIADGQTYAVAPYKNIALKYVLQKNGINISEFDIVSPNLNKPLSANETARIIRVTKEKRKITEKIPFRVTWSRIYNSNLRKTELQKGIEKTDMKTVYDTMYDDVLHDREVIDDRSVAKEYYRLVLLGKNNKAEETYDLSKAKRMRMVATAYYPGDPLAWGDGTVTFLGQKMQRGIVAVDPAVIPLKTRLFISGYGYGYAGDTGNLIKGNRVDLGVNNSYEEQSWMFRDVIVYILEPSESW